ncbi:response regulator [bacterium]|nr:response regulator [bacterium]
MQVLIADDSALVRALLQDTLEDAGFGVIACGDGQQAWNAIVDRKPRLAVLDWMTPKISGIEICQRLHENDLTDRVYTILLTSKDQPNEISQAFQAGASDHVCKPFCREELLARIKVGQRMINLQLELACSQNLPPVEKSASGIGQEINMLAQYVGDNTRFLKEAFQDIHEVLDHFHRLLDAAREGDLEASRFARIEEELQRVDIEYLCAEIPKVIDQSLSGVEQVARIVTTMKDLSRSEVECGRMKNVCEAVSHVSA